MTDLLLYTYAMLWTLFSQQANGMFNIIDGQVPSYLYRKFDKIEEKIFPYDLQIDLHLSRISGTLLYSLDRHMNQLIVTLTDGMPPTVTFELNKQKYDFSLSKLCRCDRCRYGLINFRFQMRDSLHIQCNAGSIHTVKYVSPKELNTEYPNPYNYSEKMVTSNDAHMWIVNNPTYGSISPNNDQLSGCIFNVHFKNIPVKFTEISNNIEKNCKRVCNEYICNGGECYETYSDIPICNCTGTFLNGIYCNDTISSLNVKSENQFFTFEMFKLSWQAPSSEVMTLQNGRCAVGVSLVNSTLSIKYQYKDKIEINTEGIFTKTYEKKNNYILVSKFTDNGIHMQLGFNNNWFPMFIATNLDLRKEVFEALTLRSGIGKIDLSYKTTLNDITWRKVYIISKSYEDINTIKDITTSTGNEICQIANFSLILSTSFLTLLVICLALLIHLDCYLL